MTSASRPEKLIKGPQGDALGSGPGACILLQAIPPPPTGPSDPVVVAVMLGTAAAQAQQQLVVLYLPPPLLGIALLGQSTSPLPGSRFLQEKAGSKGWQDLTCRPPAGKLSLSILGQGSPLVTPLGRGMRTLLILFARRHTEFTQPSLQGLGQSADAAFPPSCPQLIH